MALIKWTKGRKRALGWLSAGALVIAGIGFVGSYTAVRRLAEEKGFGSFAVVFPIGIDCGILVLLGLDLALTWVNLRFAPLRYIAWILTGATVAFNAAVSWPDYLGAAMHSVIPLLFIAVTEAARSALAQLAEIAEQRHMDKIRFRRWLLAPLSTFKLWRRMAIWELRSFDEVIKLEQERLIYQNRLRSRFGRAWRRKAPVEALTPLRLARYGVPLADTAPAGLAAAGIEPALLPGYEPPALTAAADRHDIPEPAPAQPADVVPQQRTRVSTGTLGLEQPRPAATAPVIPARPAEAETTTHHQANAEDPDSSWRPHPAEPAPAQPAPVPHREVEPEPAARTQAPEPEAAAFEQPAQPSPAAGATEPDQNTGETLDGGELPEDPAAAKEERARQIYLAHQKAGRRLTGKRLGELAGYSEQWGRKLIRDDFRPTYGPIEPREDADELPLEFESVPEPVNS